MVRDEGVTRFLSGGALGFDTLAAEAVLEIAADYPCVSLVIVRPCEDQTRAYRPGCMQERNRYLVEHSTVCLCYLTEPSGGTAYTVRYAASRSLPVLNLAPPNPDLLSGL